MTKQRKKTASTIICIILVVGVATSANSLDQSSKKTLYYDQDTYEIVFHLAEFLDNEFEGSFVIVVPDSGAMGYTLNALVRGKVLIADPRYSDLPSFMECAKLYSKFPTSIGVYDFTNISGIDKCSIVQNYHINMIIETKYHKVDIQKLIKYYSHIHIISYSEDFKIIILGDRFENSAGQ